MIACWLGRLKKSVFRMTDSVPTTLLRGKLMSVAAIVPPTTIRIDGMLTKVVRFDDMRIAEMIRTIPDIIPPSVAISIS